MPETTYKARCFKRPRDDGKRPGIWFMFDGQKSFTLPEDTYGPEVRATKVGFFIHGDRAEFQDSRYSLRDLECMPGFCEEITPEEALQLLLDFPDKSFPQMHDDAKAILEQVSA